MAEAPPFDPSKPFEPVGDAPAFDPSKPFEPVESTAKDTSKGLIGGIARTVAQVPLGIGRELLSMVQGAAPAALAESAAMNPRMNLPAPPQDNTLFGEYDPSKDPSRPELYAKQGQQFAKDVGLEGEMTPRNLPEKIASGAGRALPWSVMGAGPEGALPMMGIQAIGGGTGELGEEIAKQYFPKMGHWGNLLGNLVGTFGATSLINMLTKVPREVSEFGIPFTKGQRLMSEANPTNIPQLALEEDIRKGGKGSAGQSIISDFDLRQRQAAMDALERERSGLGGPPTTPIAAGEELDTALTAEAARRRGLADQFFESAAQKDAYVDRGTSNKIGRMARESLFGIGVDPTDLSAISYPQTRRMMTLMDRLGNLEGGANAGSGISLNRVEKVRQEFNKIFPNSSTADGLAAGRLKDTFDDWMTDVVTNRLISGDKTALDDLELARGFWRSWKDMTARKGGADKVIATIVNSEENSPEKVANLVLGASSIGGASASAAVVRRIKEILGADSSAIQSLRQAVFTKLTTDPTRAGVGETARSPSQVAQEIRKFFNDTGAPVARQLFDAEERSRFIRLANDLGRTLPRPVNPPSSGTTTARLLIPTAKIASSAAMAGLGYYQGNPYWGILAAAPWIRDMKAMRDALRATRDVPPRTIGYGRAMGTSAIREGYDYMSGGQ